MVEVAATPLLTRRTRALSLFETWPSWLFYAPVPFWWLFFSVRHRGLTLPTIANTQAAFSGFLGESKSAGLDLMGPMGRTQLAPYVCFTTGITVNDDEEPLRALAAMEAGALKFPIVVKPDIGQNGAGVKILRDGSALAQWLSAYPPETKIILQKYIDDEGEAGVFYVRNPKEPHGTIPSLTLKYLPSVHGDGVSTLRALILRDPRARHLAHLYFARHLNRLDRILPKGRRLRLVSVGNHCRGAIFRNGAAHITPALAAAFDAIAKEIPGFYFGRFDVKFKTLSDLEEGKNFTILEINGADSEMTHIWDADESLLGAYASLYRQYRCAFEIGACNRDQGTVPTSPGAFIAAWYRNRTRLRHYRLEE